MPASQLDAITAAAERYLALWSRSYRDRRPSDWLTALDREYASSPMRAAVYRRVQDLIVERNAHPGSDTSPRGSRPGACGVGGYDDDEGDT